MPTHDIKEVFNAIFYNENGEEIMTIPSLSTTTNIDISEDWHSTKPKMTESKEFSFDLDITYNDKIIDELTGRNKKVRIVGRKLVQNRKHKKKRINKKWAKRYGYSLILYVD